jgi:hypothetical protein
MNVKHSLLYFAFQACSGFPEVPRGKVAKRFLVVVSTERTMR